MTETPRDWRGTPIEVGKLVIYGAPVGRSIALVEATVDGFTKSGRVNLRIIRRAHGYGGKEVVHVGADRLTIVTELPPTDVPTDAEKSAQALRRMKERNRVHATHTGLDLQFPRVEVVDPRNSRWTRFETTRVETPCSVCGCSYHEGYQRECSGVSGAVA